MKRLQEYGKVHGNKHGIKDTKIAKWLDGQRMQYRAKLAKQYSNMTEERITKLKATGFPFSPDDVKKQKEEEEKEKDNDADPSSSSSSPKKKRRQKKGQQQEKKQRAMSLKKNPVIPTNEELEKLWEEQYQELVAFQKEHGDCMMYRYERVEEGDDNNENDPSSPRTTYQKKKNKKITIGNYLLIRFCAGQRKEFKKFKNGQPSDLTPERIKKLEDIGFNLSMGNKPGSGKKRKRNDDETDDKQEGEGQERLQPQVEEEPHLFI